MNGAIEFVDRRRRGGVLYKVLVALMILLVQGKSVLVASYSSWLKATYPPTQATHARIR